MPSLYIGTTHTCATPRTLSQASIPWDLAPQSGPTDAASPVGTALADISLRIPGGEGPDPPAEALAALAEENAALRRKLHLFTEKAEASAGEMSQLSPAEPPKQGTPRTAGCLKPSEAEQLKALRQQNAELRLELQRLRLEVMEAEVQDKRIRALEQHNAALKSEVVRLNSLPSTVPAGEAAAQLPALQEQTAELRREVQRLALLAKAADVQAQRIQTLEQQNAKLQREVALPKSITASPEPAKFDESKQLKFVKSENIELRLEIERLLLRLGDMQAVEEENEALRSTVMRLKEAEAGQLAHLQQQNADLRREVQRMSLQSKAADVQAQRLRALEQQNATLQEELTNLNAALLANRQQDSDARMSDLRREVYRLRTLLAASRATAEPDGAEPGQKVVRWNAAQDQLSEIGANATETVAPNWNDDETRRGEADADSQAAGSLDLEEADRRAWERMRAMLKLTKETLEPLAALNTKWGPRILSWEEVPDGYEAWAKEMAVLKYNIQGALKTLKAKPNRPTSPAELDLEPLSPQLKATISVGMQTDPELHSPCSSPSSTTSMPRALRTASFAAAVAGSTPLPPIGAGSSVSLKSASTLGPSATSTESTPLPHDSLRTRYELLYSRAPLSTGGPEDSKWITSLGASPRFIAPSSSLEGVPKPGPLRGTSLKGPAAVTIDLGMLVDLAARFGRLGATGAAMRVERVPEWLFRKGSAKATRHCIPLVDATMTHLVTFWEFLALQLYESLGLAGQSMKIDAWLEFCTMQGFLPPLNDQRKAGVSLRPLHA